MMDVKGSNQSRCPAGPPASRHSAITKASATEPRTFPESGAATMGKLISGLNQIKPICTIPIVRAATGIFKLT
jgi:hypothetical protein